MKNCPVTLLRITALLEAVSYLILLGIAMPLKYLWGMPLAVKIAGSIHGGLFIILCWALLRVLNDSAWSLRRAALVFIASLIPLVPFFMDRTLRRWATSGTASSDSVSAA